MHAVCIGSEISCGLHEFVTVPNLPPEHIAFKRHSTSLGSCSGDCERTLCCIRCDGFTVSALLHRVEMASTAPVAGQWFFSPRLCAALTAAIKCDEQE